MVLLSALNDYAIPLVIPKAATRLINAARGGGVGVGVSEFNALCRKVHILFKMERYNPIFLSAVAFAVTSRIALSRTAEHSLPHTVAKYGVKAGWALAAYVAVLGAIVYLRATYSNMANYEYIKTSGRIDVARRVTLSQWF